MLCVWTMMSPSRISRCVFAVCLATRVVGAVVQSSGAGCLSCFETRARILFRVPIVFVRRILSEYEYIQKALLPSVVQEEFAVVHRLTRA